MRPYARGQSSPAKMHAKARSIKGRKRRNRKRTFYTVSRGGIRL